MMPRNEYREAMIAEAAHKAEAYRKTLEAGEPIEGLRQQAIDRLRAADMTELEILEWLVAEMRK